MITDPVDRTEFKVQLGEAIKAGFKHGSDSIWVQRASGAMASLGPDDWDDVLDYILWRLTFHAMVPHLENRPHRARRP